MPTTSHSFSPFIPSDRALETPGLTDKVIAITKASAALAANLPEETRATIIRHMTVINSYYSNLIEGNRTRPHEVRAAQQGNFSKDPIKRALK